MSQIRICDICGKRISKFYPIVIKPPQVMAWEEHKYMQVDRRIDICMDCYAEMSKCYVTLKTETERRNKND